MDGYGGLWVVRPEIMGLAGPLMRKIDLATASFVLDLAPPDLQGVGGAVLVDGWLWAAGAEASYQMVP